MIVLVFGLPATGKTTFCKSLKKELDARHLNTDRVREKIGLKGRYDASSKQKVYDALTDQAQKALQQGENVIIDGTFHKKERRQQVVDLSGKTGHRLYLIEMKARESTIRKQLQKSRTHSEADFEVYEKIKSTFEDCSIPHLQLWTDTLSMEEMISKTREWMYEQ